MHFQMRSDGLDRGFFSHGCIRTPDTALYQLDAILNEGPHARLPVDFRNNQAWLAAIDNPHPKIDDYYYSVVYRQDGTERYGTANRPVTIACKTAQGKDDPYKVRYVEGFHTVEDNYCLTAIGKVNWPTTLVVSALMSGSTSSPALELQTGEVELGFEGGDEDGCRRRRYLADDMQDSGIFGLDLLGSLLNAGGSRQRAEEKYQECVARKRAERAAQPQLTVTTQPQFVEAPVIETRNNGRFVPPADIPGGTVTVTELPALPAPKPLVPATVEKPVAKPTVTVQQQQPARSCDSFEGVPAAQCKLDGACVECRIAQNLAYKADYCRSDWTAIRANEQSYCDQWKRSYTSYMSYRK